LRHGVVSCSHKKLSKYHQTAIVWKQSVISVNLACLFSVAQIFCLMVLALFRFGKYMMTKTVTMPKTASYCIKFSKMSTFQKIAINPRKCGMKRNKMLVYLSMTSRKEDK